MDGVSVYNITSSSKLAYHFIFEWFQMSHESLLKMRGGRKSKIHSRPTVSPASPFVRRQAEFLPSEWDWRNVSGVNYVPVVKYVSHVTYIKSIVYLMHLFDI